MLRTYVDQRCEVEFTLPYGSSARQVALVGDFNGWDERQTPMRRTGSGWQAVLELPRGQLFRYRYLVDGTTWISDPDADYCLFDELDGATSVITT